MSPVRPTVVLLHSSASSARQWDRLAERLRHGFDLHAIDLHGHGRQAAWRPSRPMSLADEAALALPLVDAARGPVHLVGHSYGGALALHVAALRRDRVGSIAVYEPVLFGLLARLEPEGAAASEAFGLADRLRALMRQGRSGAAAQAFVDYWAGGAVWATMGTDRQASIAMRMPAVMRHFDALRREPFDLSSLAGLPLLCLSGARSTPAARRIAVLLRALLPQARHETIDGLGHMGPITSPDVVNARIAAFLPARTERVPEAAVCG